MSDRDEMQRLFDGWARQAAEGKPFRESAYIYESLSNALGEIVSAQVVDRRVLLAFMGGTQVSDACKAAYDVVLFSKMPVIARFNGVEIFMAAVEP